MISQTQSCLQNSNDPDLRTITQVNSTNTIVREYILKIPDNYDSSVPSPLLINLHGFSDCAFDYAESMDKEFGMKELANQENFITAYPQGAYRPEKESTYWEPGDNGLNNIYDNDVFFIEELIADISMEFNVNPDKVYVCGFSNGGMMAYSLACNSSDLFALDIKDVSASSLNATDLNDGKVLKEEYSSDQEGSCLTVFTVYEEYDKPGGHVWFSDDIEGQSPNRIMWDFFENTCNQSTATMTLESEKSMLSIHPNPFINIIREWT